MIRNRPVASDGATGPVDCSDRVDSFDLVHVGVPREEPPTPTVVVDGNLLLGFFGLEGCAVYIGRCKLPSHPAVLVAEGAIRGVDHVDVFCSRHMTIAIFLFLHLCTNAVDRRCDGSAGAVDVAPLDPAPSDYQH